MVPSLAPSKQTKVCMSVLADRELDHLELVVPRFIGATSKAVPGMGWRYWEQRLLIVNDQFLLLPVQQRWLQSLLRALRSSPSKNTSLENAA
jgi:hypothetical protein